VVLGDGAVGLCAVIAATRLGAEQIIVLGRHPERIALACELGATDGEGVQSVLECVGCGEATETAIGVARPGGAVGRVGVPQYLDELLPDVLEGRIDPTA